uniref:Uncharacterized protein n=1 Tax=Corynebacterium diphtheriae TaxID=1717 RepID=A0A5Q0USA8_CORDP|nr:hypothetical protein [Corynebacterium diphtheriae]
MSDVAAHAPCHGLAVAHGWHLVVAACAAVGVCDVVGVLIGVDDRRVCQALALLAQAVASLKRMPKGCFVACCGSLGNPENAHAVDKFRVVLVESTGDFRVYVLGKRFKRLGFFTTCFDRVNEFAARAKLLAWGGVELVVSCHIPYLLYQVSKTHHPVVLSIPTISGRGLSCVERVAAKAMGKVRVMV